MTAIKQAKTALMIKLWKKDKTNTYLPFIIVLLACCFLVVLLLTIRRDVFYSGDAGLKYLVVKQFISTGEYKILHAEQPGWVNRLWSGSYYPFKPPFVYNTTQGRMVAFPPFFQWLNAPFYNWFGYQGLYVIPAVSTVLLWICFIQLLQRIKIQPLLIAFGTLLLALCSPVTMYGAMYWEHCTALLLLFVNIIYLVKPPSGPQAVILGLLSGSAVWLRPEAIVYCGLFMLAAIYNFYRDKTIAHLYFAFAVSVVIAGFFVFNTFVYGDALGAHGYQLVREAGVTEQVAKGFTILTHTHARLILYYPVALIFYAMTVWMFIKRPLLPVAVYQLAAIACLFSVIIPFILPNAGGKQWGPRYLLPLIPVMVTVISMVLKYFPVDFFKNKWGIAIVVLIVGYSMHLNVYQAATSLKKDYAYRVTPGLRFLESDSCKVIVVQNQYITQEFAALFASRKMFLAETAESFTGLKAQLVRAGVSEIIYISIVNEKHALFNRLHKGDTGLRKIGGYYFGKYVL
jgi:hypothetical protein